ncbi:hypothetical protein [Staphylococcus warneri]|jgi:hypothetical protein|uniref:hypothetical protein n=1 Tax=Staphylococcus warneri TaxID=1292 RepID=UPI0018883EAA|nr:hypothetical protein [Staphylococcus warneri]MBF2265079.1 hypothetical protein [Staphylococcus warneri]MBF2267516.1 hypothetical protein [Staphylococcus warneri]MBF2272144.1 hypothetical protein [Staphylococcus warneri]MCF7595901.1 hypothetical protein [Staphylococcus warneri]
MEIINTILAFIAALTGILTLLNEIRKNRHSKIAIKSYINNKTANIRKEISKNPDTLIKNVGIEWTVNSWIRKLKSYEELLNVLKLEQEVLKYPKIIKKIESRVEKLEYLKTNLNELTNTDDKRHFYKILNNHKDIITNF